MATKEQKRVADLRVVDLRSQLEKRDLDKSGNKAVLVERLQKVNIWYANYKVYCKEFKAKLCQGRQLPYDFIL